MSVEIRPKRSGKRTAALAKMQEAADSGEHAHLGKRSGIEGVHCPPACRAAGVKEWSGHV